MTCRYMETYLLFLKLDDSLKKNNPRTVALRHAWNSTSHPDLVFIFGLFSQPTTLIPRLVFLCVRKKFFHVLILELSVWLILSRLLLLRVLVLSLITYLSDLWNLSNAVSLFFFLNPSCKCLLSFLLLYLFTWSGTERSLQVKLIKKIKKKNHRWLSMFILSDGILHFITGERRLSYLKDECEYKLWYIFLSSLSSL